MVCPSRFRAWPASRLPQNSEHNGRFLFLGDDMAKRKAIITDKEVESFRATLPEAYRHETFSLLIFSWDVVKAYAIAKKHEVEPLDVPVNKLAGWLDLVYVKEEYVASAECLADTRPLMCVLNKFKSGEKTYILIDGNHRLSRAVKDGRETIKAFLLDEEFSLACKN
jgi:hypothetical protein